MPGILSTNNPVVKVPGLRPSTLTTGLLVLPYNGRFSINNLTNNDVGITLQDRDNLTRMGTMANVPPPLGIYLLEQSLYMRTPLLQEHPSCGIVFP